ncbi:MAG: peptide ABC transporter substrate-binding protein, partial [Gammaproteobacteria bacterium]|nr:peptide ABC transporter substrate-binding protein [Gammaproteobacteria bacterium]
MKALRLGALLAASIVLLGALLFACSDPASEIAAESVLHRGLSSDPESLDPHKARSVQAAEVLRDIGEGLLAYSATGELVAGT